jgi:hypothetical protein
MLEDTRLSRLRFGTMSDSDLVHRANLFLVKAIGYRRVATFDRRPTAGREMVDASVSVVL